MPYSAASRLACVPFPAAGCPKKISRTYIPPQLASPPPSPLPTSAQATLFQEAFVMSHDEVRLDLLHRVHSHADDDQ